MKVLLVMINIDKSWGGPARSVPLLARGLSEAGVDTTLMVVRTSNMNTRLLEGSEVKLHVLEPEYSVKDIEAFIKKEKFNIIHNQSIWTPLFHQVRRLATKLGIPLISMPRGSLEPWSLEQKSFKKKVAMALYQRRDLNLSVCIQATSDMEADNIKALGFTNRIEMIPNGLDMDRLPCRSLDYKSGSPISPIKKQVLFLSRIHQKKGIEILLDAWQGVVKRLPGWQLLIVGNGDGIYIEELHGMISRMGLAHSVRILPPSFGDEKIRLYHESSLFVLPSFSENFGMAIAEAMACGIPVITTSGTPWQVLKDKKLGWYVDLSADNLEKSLAEAMSMQPENLYEMGQRAAEFVRQEYDYRQVALRVAAMYDSILNEADPNE